MRALWVVILGPLFPPPPSGPGRRPWSRRSTIQTAAGLTLNFRVELARTEAERAQGLMYRDKSAPDAGMLFFSTPLDWSRSG